MGRGGRGEASELVSDARTVFFGLLFMVLSGPLVLLLLTGCGIFKANRASRLPLVFMA